MKKSLFGFSAKVAMAVLAVCSFVLTSCYEKTPVAKIPSEYYVVGTVYGIDAEGNQTVLTGAKVTVDGKSVSNPFEVKLDGYKASVEVSATAEGYVAGKRNVTISKVGEFNQTSVTGADLVLVKVAETPEVPAVLEIGAPVAASMTVEEVKATFGISYGEVSVGSEGLVEVCMHYAFDADMHANAHVNFGGEHLNHTNGITTQPYLVEDSLYVGYVLNATEVAEENMDELEYAISKNEKINTVCAGTDYSAFKNSFVPFAVLINQDEMAIAGYCVCKDFVLYEVPVTVGEASMTAYVLQAKATQVTPIYADSHDNHDNHDNHHNNHANHSGATAWGGGAGDAE